MNDDISPRLLEVVKSAFNSKYNADPKVNWFLERVKKQIVSYEDAYAYSKKIGELLGDSFAECITYELLPNGKMYWHISKDVVEPMLRNNHKLVNEAGLESAKVENSEAGIKLGSVGSPIDEDRMYGLMDSITTADFDEEIEESVFRRMLQETTTNFTEHCFDEFIRGNADFQYQSGFEPQVIRIYHSGSACKWCQGLAGTYDYSEVNYRGCEVWQRHANCHCSVIFKSNKERYMEGAHTKRRLETFDSAQELFDLDKGNNYGKYTKKIKQQKDIERYYKNKRGK